MKFKSLPITHNYSLAIGIIASLNSLPVFSADDELFFEMPIVLSANRLEQPVANAAVSISVIDKETIESSGARNIPEVLRLVPGMQVGYSGNEFGSKPKYVVAYHGHSDEFSKQMQVLIDGRSIYDPFLGGIDWNAIPVNINDIERIEVSRGPNLATYGSNSFQAAINIITRTAAEDQGSFVQTNIGNNDIADLTYRYGGSNGQLDYRITGSSYNDAGLDSANQFDYPDDSQSNNIDYRLDYQLDNKNSLSYQGGYGQNEQQADQNHDGLIPNVRTVDNTHLFQFIKWENAIDQDNTLLLQYYYNLTDQKDSSRSDTISFGNGIDDFTLDIAENIKTERHNLELTHFTSPNDAINLVWGLSAQADIVHAPLSLGTGESVTNNQFRLFANIEWQFNQQNVINVGGLVEKNSFTKTELSPRLSFTHIFNKQHSIRLGISQAIRSPFIFEAKANQSLTQEVTSGGVPIGLTLVEQQFLGGVVTNQDLKNEKILSRELAYYGSFLNSTLLFNARFFYDSISDFIDAQGLDASVVAPNDNVPDDLNNFGDPTARNRVQTFTNKLESTTTGIELELDYRIDPTLRLIASGAIINISSVNDAISESSPRNSYSFLFSKDFNEKYSGSLAYYYVDKLNWTDSRGGTGAYKTLDMKISRKINFNKTNGSISLVLRNLLNDYSDYQENPSNITAPKVVHSSLAYLDFRLNF